MIELSERANVICMPGHNVVYDDDIRKIKRMIESGDIGKVVSFFYMFNSFFSEEAAARYPGVIRQIITHHLYTMLYLAGNPKEIMAMKSCLHYEKLLKEDLAMAILKLENGALAHLDLSFVADDISSDPWTFLIKVLGTEGSARHSWNDKVLAKKGVSHTREYVAYPNTFINEDMYFIDICLNGGSPISTLEDAIHAQSILEAIEVSIETGRSVNWSASDCD
jgi:predicted dehydrogenase